MKTSMSRGVLYKHREDYSGDIKIPVVDNGPVDVRSLHIIIPFDVIKGIVENYEGKEEKKVVEKVDERQLELEV